MDRFTGILGILAVLLAAWLGSTDRRRIRWRTVAWGLGLQIIFASSCCASTSASAPWPGPAASSRNMLSATVAGTPSSSAN